MKLDLKTLQMFMLFALFGLIYAGRMVKGAARETPEGLSFGMKPLVMWGRIIVLPVYFALFAYPLWMSAPQHSSVVAGTADRPVRLHPVSTARHDRADADGNRAALLAAAVEVDPVQRSDGD